MTGLTSTLINIKRTVEAVKPGHTLTSIHADEVMAGGSVPARAGLTLVYFSFTVDSWSRRKQRVINAAPVKFRNPGFKSATAAKSSAFLTPCASLSKR